jgi:hypothetical protein
VLSQRFKLEWIGSTQSADSSCSVYACVIVFIYVPGSFFYLLSPEFSEEFLTMQLPSFNLFQLFGKSMARLFQTFSLSSTCACIIQA